MLPAIAWSILVFWYNYKSGHKTGFGKLLYCAIGCSTVYYTPWICITRYLPDKSLTVAHQCFPLIDYVAVVASILQDFRDVEGDIKLGRVTYPMRYGDKCRIFIACLILITPLTSFILFFGFFVEKPQILQLALWMFFVTSCCYLAYRLMYKRNPVSDSLTYTSWSILSGIFFVAPAFLVSI